MKPKLIPLDDIQIGTKIKNLRKKYTNVSQVVTKGEDEEGCNQGRVQIVERYLVLSIFSMKTTLSFPSSPLVTTCKTFLYFFLRFLI